MSEITFDGTDPADVASREAEEARLLELGGKLQAEEESIRQDTYDRARKESEAELNYAGKFKSAEDLEKAYLELQKKLGQKEEATQEEGEDTSDEDSDESTEEEEPSASEEVQVLLDASDEYYSNNNELKPETLQKLKELPSEKLIEAYLELQKNNSLAVSQPLSDSEAQDIVKSVGGQDAYNETLSWAAENLKPEEVAAYDNVVNSGNKDAIFFAVQALNQRYKDAVGFEGKTVSGKSVKNSIKGFRSQAELARAIADPRYRNDPAYRMDIESKLAASGDLL
jgi:high-affinity Fe2+/Pb2+ permease